jgi:hypothetical protein
MGAEVFVHEANGENAQEAFRNARNQAGYDHGHSGYSGTIVEKDDFVMIDCPEGVDPEEYADTLIDNDDERIDDKWGPAGCIKVNENSYLFFGWASS